MIITFVYDLNTAEQYMQRQLWNLSKLMQEIFEMLLRNSRKINLQFANLRFANKILNTIDVGFSTFTRKCFG